MLDEDRTARWEPVDLRSADQPTAPYLEAVVAYATRGSTRFHVPGHKGGAGADPGLRAALGWAALGADIPQDIEGIDLGPEPTPYQRAEQLAAEAHGAARTFFLTNGASQGNHALCLALAPLGASVVVQRNSHASVIDGLVLSGATNVGVPPESTRTSSGWRTASPPSRWPPPWSVRRTRGRPSSSRRPTTA